MLKKCHQNMMKGLFLLSSFIVFSSLCAFCDDFYAENLYRIDQKEAKKQCPTCQPIIDNEGNKKGTFRQLSNGNAFVEETDENGNTTFKTIPTSQQKDKFYDSHLKSKMFIMKEF